MDDNIQIMEQILPYFSPEMSVNINLVPGQESQSIPIVLNGVTTETPIDVNENENRFYTFTYNFSVKGNYYAKKKTSHSTRIFTYASSGSSFLHTDTGDFILSGAELGTTVSGTNIAPGTYITSVTASTVGIKPPTLGEVNGDIIFTGSNIFSTLAISGCSYTAPDNIIIVPSDAIGGLYAGMEISGDGIGPDTYIVSVNSNNTITISTRTFSSVEDGIIKVLVSKTVEHIRTDLHVNNNYVQIQQDWLDQYQRIEQKFQEYESNASNPNPFNQ